MLESKIKGGIFGVAVGDALGTTVDFMSQDAIKEKYGRLTEILGGGWLNLSPGEFTDDTDLTVIVGEGIIKNPDNPRNEIGKGFMEWFESNPRDIGNITKLSLKNYFETDDWDKAAALTKRKLHNRVAGNGALMRTLPISYAYLKDYAKMDKMAISIASMTHADVEAELSSVFYNRFAAYLIESKDKMLSYKKVLDDVKEFFDIPEAKKLYDMLITVPNMHVTDLRSSGYVIDTIISALFIFLEIDNFEETLIQAVNMGGDADTLGAVTGGLAGTYYGIDAIPKRWIEKIMEQDRLEKVAEGLINLAQK